MCRTKFHLMWIACNGDYVAKVHWRSVCALGQLRVARKTSFLTRPDTLTLIVCSSCVGWMQPISMECVDHWRWIDNVCRLRRCTRSPTISMSTPIFGSEFDFNRIVCPNKTRPIRTRSNRTTRDFRIRNFYCVRRRLCHNRTELFLRWNFSFR